MKDVITVKGNINPGPAILSIEVETVYRKWIAIDRYMIKIMDAPSSQINWEDDFLEEHVRAFDRVDGVNYYKKYEESYIVDLITALIKDLLLKPACKGEAVDPE